MHFVFYTSSPSPKKFYADNVKKQIFAQFSNLDAIGVSIFFAADIKQEIETSKAIKPVVERGKIQIDKKDNYLRYGDDAAIVNVSAFSIKQLFWLKNNGITVICDDFWIDGREVHLKNFSIVNGGQTTYMLQKSKFLDKDRDFWLSCKIIKTSGTTETEKNSFSLEIAKAANSQKPIKPADLRANAPEQRSFAQAMRTVGIFYQTKRGEKIPKQFLPAHLHTKLLDVGKLCLAAIFQLPCKSRSKPSDVYKDEYYNPIFNERTQKQVSKYAKSGSILMTTLQKNFYQNLTKRIRIYLSLPLQLLSHMSQGQYVFLSLHWRHVTIKAILPTKILHH